MPRRGLLGIAVCRAAVRADDVPPAAGWPTSPRTGRMTREKQQTAIALLFPGASRRDHDALCARVVSAAIASGLGGRFFEQLRDKQSLAYTVSAFPIERRAGGAFAAYIATSPAREDEARDGIAAEFAKLRDAAPSAEELERAQRYLIGTHAIAQQSGGTVLGEIWSTRGCLAPGSRTCRLRGAHRGGHAARCAAAGGDVLRSRARGGRASCAAPRVGSTSVSATPRGPRACLPLRPTTRATQCATAAVGRANAGPAVVVGGLADDRGGDPRSTRPHARACRMAASCDASPCACGRPPMFTSQCGSGGWTSGVAPCPWRSRPPRAVPALERAQSRIDTGQPRERRVDHGADDIHHRSRCRGATHRSHCRAHPVRDGAMPSSVAGRTRSARHSVVRTHQVAPPADARRIFGGSDRRDTGRRWPGKSTSGRKRRSTRSTRGCRSGSIEGTDVGRDEARPR